VSDELPAWTEPFASAVRQGLARPSRMGSVSREWALGGATGKGVRVAIIDSGVDGDHPRVHGRLTESHAVVLGEETAEVITDQDAADVFGHGTACAGIIVGLAPEVELVSVRVLGADLKGKGRAFVAALEWVIEQRIEVVNLSLSSKSEQLYGVFHELADEAYFNNVTLVSAANNVPGPSYPSLFSSVISVAAHDEPQPLRFYYNPSPPVEFGAWGVDVPVAWLGGTETLATGNSFAAPHIAGMVALLRSKHPGLTPFEVKAILAAIADNASPGATLEASAG
jgi:subtilisin family serine protease